MASYADEVAPAGASATLQGIFGAIFEGIGMNTVIFTTSTRKSYQYIFFKKEHPSGVCWAVSFSKTTAEQYSSGPLGSTPSFTVPPIVWSISSWTVWVQSPLKVVQLPDFYSLFF